MASIEDRACSGDTPSLSRPMTPNTWECRLFRSCGDIDIGVQNRWYSAPNNIEPGVEGHDGYNPDGITPTMVYGRSLSRMLLPMMFGSLPSRPFHSPSS